MKWDFHALAFIWKYCHKFEYLKLQGYMTNKNFSSWNFHEFFLSFHESHGGREGLGRKEGKREGRKESLREDEDD